MKRILLDTHVLLWWLADSPLLGARARSLIADTRNPIYVSAATTWEIAIKRAKGMLEAPDDMDRIVEDEGFEKLPITLFHGEQAGSLPEIHRDPFDRMLIAQAQAEGLELLTKDSEIPAYNIKVIDAGA